MSIDNGFEDGPRQK